ncbi:sulfurtransferase TusA family protein [Natranaerobius thermophilus]|uniref:SirA family protein n=1 Tax=Natranaerobius thermophilus (strain ATCC BAA-1301 / DSM 18059 / JW/NM-WN-LF) TaxID=457570 RepID=B2A0W8_NATTJ|nr:sulfurtransferase TusA family protein [Natranaerobius thermophilus]ACB85998.1 SirA family protein [Natranaerobius thermophilus JW/NM-WN-LF]
MAEKDVKTVDARGFSCPQPVINTKKALSEEFDELQVLVDNNIAKENVSRFVNSKGFDVSVEQDGEEFVLKISKS